MADTTNDAFDLEIEVSDPALAADIEAWLKKNDIEATPPPEGILPVIPIVIAAVIGVAGLARLIFYIRDKTRCQVIIDARSDTVRHQVDCSIRDGKIVVLTKDGEKVDIQGAPEILDVTEIARAAVSGSADAVKKAADAVGAIVRTEPVPASP